VLAAKGNIWCWPAAFVSTLIYTVIFYDVYLWMDSLLQLYYLLMAFYGWYCWRTHQSAEQRANQANDIPSASFNNKNQEKRANDRNKLIIQQWPLILHAKIIISLTLLSLALGWLMATYTPAHFPYLDSATTVFAVFATYLVTQKVLENWLYFIVIDFVSIYLYVEKSLTPTAALFGCYVLLAGYGYWQWRKVFYQQNDTNESSTASLA
jgi:nicotinamide mononucleotide transporter